MLILILVVAAVLIIIGFFAKDKYEVARGLYFSIAGGVLLLVVALFLMTDGIEIQQGYNSTTMIDSETNHTIEDLNYKYTSLDSSLDTVLFWVLLLAGLVTILVSSINLYNQKYVNKDNSPYLDEEKFLGDWKK